MSLNLIWNVLPALYQSVEPLVRIGTILKDKNFPYFRLGTGLYYTCNGTLEAIQATLQKDLDPKTESIRERIFRKLSPPREFLYSHGSALMSMGLLNCIEALHHFGAFSLESQLCLVRKAANGCFFLASLLALEENVRFYNEIQKYEDSEKFTSAKKAAFLGMLSNVGYIITTALSLYGSATAVALLVGILGTFCGILKLIYDFLSSHPSLKAA